MSPRAPAALLLFGAALMLTTAATLARPASAAAASAASTKPWFCHDLDCPEYEVVENLTSIGVELRRYAPSTWVETVVENATSVAGPAPPAKNGAGPAAGPAAGAGGGGFPGASLASDANGGSGYERAVAIGFYKLFRYISGENLTGQKIAMTAPVRVTVTPGTGPACADKFAIAFFIAPSVKSPPPPTDPSVSVTQTPETAYYVNGFGGWATGATYADRARSVAAALEGAGRAIDASYFATAGYDSPFRLTGRHNEVWIPALEEKKKAGVAKKAAVALAAPAKQPAAAPAAKPSAALKLPTANN